MPIGHEARDGPATGRAPSLIRHTPGLWVGLLAGFTVIGLLDFGYKFLQDRLADPLASPLPSLINELTGAWGAAVVVALAVPLIARYRLTRESWRRRLPAYLALMVAYSVAHTLMNLAFRGALYPLAGLGGYDYGAMRLRMPMEFLNDVGNYWTAVAIIHAVVWYRELRDREVRTARLEAELSRAHLDNLRERLHPHFLFNTLNAISDRMYTDAGAADRMISRLGDMLRSALDSPGEQETRLTAELELLDSYLEIMRLRFGDRLTTRIEAEERAGDVLVPVFLLQPLVENAIRHGVARRTGPGVVVVSAARAGDALRIEVLDDGPGLDGDAERALRAGVGLSNTLARLRHLHGGAADLRIENRASGGARVVVTLPWRTGAAEATAAGVGARIELERANAGAGRGGGGDG